MALTRPGLDLAISERDFQRKVLDLAKMMGWRVAHFRAALNARGHYQTPVAADGACWPDLYMLHPGRRTPPLYRELKSQKGKVDPLQQRWGDDLLACGQDWSVWRPSDWPEIVDALSGGRAASR